MSDTTVLSIPPRLDFESLAPDVYRAVSHLDQVVTRQLDAADIDHRLRELIRIRASQLNGCAYCIDMHCKDARAVGETEQRIYALPAWWETPFFSDRERAALSFTETVTRLADTHVPTRGVRRGRRRVQPGRGRRAARPDPGHQRVEHARRHDPRLGARLVPTLTPRGARRPPHLGAHRLIPASGRVQSHIWDSTTPRWLDGTLWRGRLWRWTRERWQRSVRHRWSVWIAWCPTATPRCGSSSKRPTRPGRTRTAWRWR